MTGGGKGPGRVAEGGLGEVAGCGGGAHDVGGIAARGAAAGRGVHVVLEPRLVEVRVRHQNEGLDAHQHLRGSRTAHAQGAPRCRHGMQ